MSDLKKHTHKKKNSKVLYRLLEKRYFQTHQHGPQDSSNLAHFKLSIDQAINTCEVQNVRERDFITILGVFQHKSVSLSILKE